jgi:hypothetical protein
MKRLYWGIGLSVFGGLAVIGGLTDGSNPQGVAGGLVMAVAGTLLGYFGWQAVAAAKATAEMALQQIRACGVIDAAELARSLHLSEVDVRGHVLEAQRKGLVPLQAEVV